MYCWQVWGNGVTDKQLKDFFFFFFLQGIHLLECCQGRKMDYRIIIKMLKTEVFSTPSEVRGNNKRLQLKPFLIHLKAHKVMQQWCFYLDISLSNSLTN